MARFDFLSRPMFTKENLPDSVKESFLKEKYDIVDDDIIRHGLYTEGSRVRDPLLDERQ